MLEISHCNYRRHILQNRKHKRYQMNLNSHYKKSLFVSWNLNIQQMFFPALSYHNHRQRTTPEQRFRKGIKKQENLAKNKKM